jgi:phosphoribosylformylglycinamidine synthase subunit PurL
VRAAAPIEPEITPALVAEHGLSEEEYRSCREILGREPNYTELGIFSAMWSEHCSYKSSKVHLKRLPTTGPRVVHGPGENAGVVAIGDGRVAVFKMESHNHPSFIEPFQGAATGVGGILRDVFTMGARPVAALNSLRFGAPDHPRTRFLVGGVVSGIGFYGNAFGVPTVGGEVSFHPCYNGNILVNAFALGVAKSDGIWLGQASGAGNSVVYVGSRTGRDGIHGATMASDTFESDKEARRPTVQVGDPFMEKLLLEACLELMKGEALVGIQDMGAAGLTCSTLEMAGRAGTGVLVDLAKVPRREPGMSPYEVMLSESQERMLMVVKRGREEEALRVFRKWDLEAEVIGEVTGDGVARITDGGRAVGAVPAAPLSERAPVYRRPVADPAPSLRRRLSLESVPVPSDLTSVLSRLLGSPNLCSKEWVYRRYDHTVGASTIVAPGSDAAVVRVKGTGRALALASDCNSRHVLLDPGLGAALAVAESARNVACAGATPIGATDCLNFGSPENPEIMGQFARAVDGIAEACRALEIPIVSGNVSFYNETDGQAVHPTPTVAVVGLLEDARRALTQWFKRDGDAIVILGSTREEIGGSEYLAFIHGREEGPPPALDLAAESALQKLLVEAASRGWLRSAHDASDGGLAVALAEACFTDGGSAGAEIDLTGMEAALGREIRPDALLFGESASRAVITVAADDLRFLEAEAGARGVPFHAAGRVRGSGAGARLRIRGRAGVLLDAGVAELRIVWDNGFSSLMGG